MAKKRNVEAIYPLSPVQAGMMFHTLYAPQSGIYFEQLNCIFQGNLAITAFKYAWEQIIQRHDPLRTAFIWEQLNEPVQVVQKLVSLPWQQYDWRSMSEGEQQAQLEGLLQSDRAHDFDLTRAPLMRLKLIQLTDDTYQFIWSVHHIILDGWSQSVLLKELLEIYEAHEKGEILPLPKPRPYRDYVSWLRQQDTAAAERFWRQRLAGITAPTPLGIDRARNATPESEMLCAQQNRILTEATTSALQKLARQHQLTLGTLIQGAWALLLSHYSSEQEVVFGVTSSGRPPTLAKVETMIGLFINTLPMRIQVTPGATLLSWLHEIQVQQIEQWDYVYTPLVDVQGWSSISRGVSLFESIVVIENYPVEAVVDEHKSLFAIRDVRMAVEQREYPLVIAAAPGRMLKLHIGYRCDRFEATTIERMHTHLQTLLEAMAANPNQLLANFPVLPLPERDQILHEWNTTWVAYPHTLSLSQRFEAQVERTPAAIAVMFEDQCISYQMLNERANQLAHYLQQLGVQPETTVGVCMERSLEMVIALLGILKAGGVYMPLDPSYPQERLTFMLQDAQVPILLTQQRFLDQLPVLLGQFLFCLDHDWEQVTKQTKQNPHNALQPAHLAYVIYTSGSTGTPKGVMVPHQALINHMSWLQTDLLLTSSDRVLQKTPISFDVSISELFEALLWGGQLVMARPDGHLDSAYLVKLIHEQQITIVHCAPSMLQMLLEEPELAHCNSLRRIYSGGDSLSTKLQKQFLSHLLVDMHNLYGPTEACISVCALTSQPSLQGPTIPIGHPIANTQIYLLDRQLEPVPIEVPGELYIGGDNLARGYLNRPDLTSELFIPHPFSKQPGMRLYRTGDRARYLPDGSIEFLGRLDNQVKLRGYRIELGEIEAVLNEQIEVRECIVIVREDAPDDKRLVVYLVLNPPWEGVPDDLRQRLLNRLPAYMVPASVLVLNALPLTSNGKIDRHALPNPEATATERTETFVGPRTPVEEVLAGIWCEVLGLQRVGVHDDFFELGGHSLLATLVISRTCEIFQVNVAFRDLFTSSTIAGFAATVQVALQQSQKSVLPPLKLSNHEGERSLAPVQQNHRQPEKPQLSWVTRSAGIPAGTVAYHHLQSTILNNTRRIYVYTPPDYAPTGDPYTLLLLLDGLAYIHLTPTPTILDNLLAFGQIPPLVAVMPDSLGEEVRYRELACYPPFLDFVRQELIPWVRQHYYVTTNATQTIVGGSSLGGLAAAFVGLNASEMFGNVLSQSGAFGWKPKDEQEYEWLIRQYEITPKLPLKFYLDIGLLESDSLLGGPSPILSNRHLRDVLFAKNYQVHYTEHDGGHDHFYWRKTFADGLLALIGNRNTNGLKLTPSS